ncbi:hypothetical protein O6H91_12G022400 [Diphasiastrum complanatum]|uniref:Uncharacterized protein n=1 Tax=Diphasiastrum complanatum TaxID=34168 RepID=A0ACC2C0P7_DIPCM|nr:hypothetical protein O6H91_12G022400 [Diphasiastrum complanatum]
MSMPCSCFAPGRTIVQGLSADRLAVLTSIKVGASAFSFLGSCCIVSCYLLFKDLRKFSFKLVFYLAFSDLTWSFFNLLGDPGRGFLCYLQGYSTHFFSIASFLWTTTIAFTLHRTVVQHKADVEEMGPLFHLYVWGTSLIMSVLPSIGNNYGLAGAWCWIQTGTRIESVLRFISFYVPLWGAVIYNASIYYQVIRTLNYAAHMALDMSDRQLNADVKVDTKMVNRWSSYPFILIGSWSFSTINDIHNFLKPHQPLFWLCAMDIGAGSLMGFFNSIAYGFNAAVRRTLWEKLNHCFEAPMFSDLPSLLVYLIFKALIWQLGSTFL